MTVTPFPYTSCPLQSQLSQIQPPPRPLHFLCPPLTPPSLHYHPSLTPPAHLLSPLLSHSANQTFHLFKETELTTWKELLWHSAAFNAGCHLLLLSLPFLSLICFFFSHFHSLIIEFFIPFCSLISCLFQTLTFVNILPF